MSLRPLTARDAFRAFGLTLPEVVCLCGSTRFHDEFMRANYELTMQGKIVLSVGFFVHGLSDEQLIERMRETWNAIRGEENPFREMLAATRNAHSENVGCTPEQKEKLDELHLRKIDLADSVHVLNKGGYIGSSTMRELAYAVYLGRNVTFLETDLGERFLSERSHALGELIAQFMGKASEPRHTVTPTE